MSKRTKFAHLMILHAFKESKIARFNFTFNLVVQSVFIFAKLMRCIKKMILKLSETATLKRQLKIS